MIRKATTWVFLAGIALAGAILWQLSQSSWGRNESYAILSREYRKIGAGQQIEAPRLNLRPLKGEPRPMIEVPRDVYDIVKDGDDFEIRTQTIPVAGVDLLHYSIVRQGSPIKEWDEGWPFFGVVLGAASFAGGGLLLALFLFVASVFRLKAPSE